MVGLMKTVSMGTSAREGRASGGSHSRMSYNFCYKRRTSLSLRDGMGWSQSSTHTYTQTYMEWAAADCLGEGWREKTSVCMYALPGEPAWEELQKRST